MSSHRKSCGINSLLVAAELLDSSIQGGHDHCHHVGFRPQYPFMTLRHDHKELEGIGVIFNHEGETFLSLSKSIITSLPNSMKEQDSRQGFHMIRGERSEDL